MVERGLAIELNYFYTIFYIIIIMKFSGFMNVYMLDDMSWEYQFDGKSLKAPTLKELEVLVSLYGLKWSRLDEELANSP